MSTQLGLSTLTVGAMLTLLGCASTYDRDLVERRSRSLYGPRHSAQNAQAEDTGATPAIDPRTLDEADLESYLRFGLVNNAELCAAFKEWRAAAERIEQVSTLPEPRLSYGEFIEEVQTRTGPQERRFGISQAFPWPGTLGTKARVSEHESEALWHRVDSTRLRVAAEIEVAYFEYAFLGREMRITKRLLELLRGLEPVVQSRVRAGAGQEDLLRLQVEIGRLEDDLASIVRRRPVLSARLAEAMTLRAATGELLPLPELTEPRTVGVDVERRFNQALEHNPELRSLAERLRAAQAAEDLAGYRRYPEFSVGLDYIQTGDALNSGTPGSGDDPFMLGLSLSLPIWGSSYSAAEREARFRGEAARQRIVDAQSRIQASVEEQAYRVDDAARRIGLYRDSLIPRANESLELTLASYRTGSATVLDLIDSERALLEFELSFWRACREHLQGKARLKALTGGVE